MPGKMKAFPILAVALLNLLWAEGLSQEIRGRVHNEEQHALEMVSVALLHHADSTVAAYTQTDEEGRFSLRDIPAGAFYLQLHLLGFDPWHKGFVFDGGLLDLGAIGLRANTALEEIVVTLVTPIALKKDTVSYHAAAFRVQEGATVEDLLKKLPGIEVDQAGKVTAQGEPVTKIYLDGKEFFTGDPAISGHRHQEPFGLHHQNGRGDRREERQGTAYGYKGQGTGKSDKPGAGGGKQGK